MAKWSAMRNNWTPVAVADTTNFTDNGYFAVKGGTTVQRMKVVQVKMAGLAGASAPMQTVLARDSTVGATSLSGGTIAPLDVHTENLAANPVVFSVSTTKPQRSSTLYLLDLGFNAFGGLIRIELQDENAIQQYGSAASVGEMSISHLANGTPGLTSCHIVIEPF